ncbi:MAG: PQQ-binding-like beta-propeller repeat protein [Deltaproteobacteria bacterium]|nr:PQQ-binding-like beta-propeller repeat protein [Deltaproteobacteria bacterium]
MTRLRRATLALALAATACTTPPSTPRRLPFDPLPSANDEPAATAEAAANDAGDRAAWREPFAPRVTAELRVGGAVRAPVTVLRGSCPRRRDEDCGCADDLLLVAALDGTLSAFDADGAPRWSWSCGAPLSNPPTPAPGDVVLARCDDGTLAALDPADGRERWRVARPCEAGMCGPAEWSPWAATAFVAGRGVAAVARCGTVAWSHPSPGPFPGRLALSGTTLVAAGLDRQVRGFDAATGEERWRQWVVGGVEGGVLELRSGAVVAATLYGRVYAFGLPGGAPRWEASVGELVRGRPAEGTDGTVLVPVADGALTGLGPETGVLRFRHALPAAVLAEPLAIRPAEGSPDEAHVVVADRDGFVYELAYPVRVGPPVEDPATAVRELWRFNAGLPIDGRPTPVGATLLLGLEDGRVLRLAPGLPDCAAVAEAR